MRRNLMRGIVSFMLAIVASLFLQVSFLAPGQIALASEVNTGTTPASSSVVSSPTAPATSAEASVEPSPTVMPFTAPVSDTQYGDAIYLNGQRGDDTKDGLTEESAVKSFEKAKELARKHKSIKTIYVCGTTQISGEISLKGTNAILMRAEGFKGYLLEIKGKEATLSDITIDGNKDKVDANKASIYVSSSSLTIKEGAVLRNNKNVPIKKSPANGGAIQTYSSKLILNGGLIEDNQATNGGGIYLYERTTMVFKSGEVKNNHAIRFYDPDLQLNLAAGGGICVDNSSSLEINSDNALILNNSSDEIGGGVSLGTQQNEPASYLKMTGGIVSKK